MTRPDILMCSDSCFRADNGLICENCEGKNMQVRIRLLASSMGFMFLHV